MVFETKTKKYAVYRGSRFLSGYYPNGARDVFAFRKNDMIPFENKEEAEKYIENVKKTTETEAKSGRWDEKTAKKNVSIANNLKAKEWEGF